MSSKLDRIDHKILASLQRDGRITKTKLSEDVGLSVTRCWERMRQLERLKVIRGYHADIDLKKLARLSLFQVHVRLLDSTPAHARQFEGLVHRYDEIIACIAVLGTIDYVLTIVAVDVEAFQDILDNMIESDAIKFEFVTFPVSRQIKSLESVSLLNLLK